MPLLLLLALLAIPAAPSRPPASMPATVVDVAYGPYADPARPHSAERLDLYAHPEARAPQPVLIEVHPGGFCGGSKSDFQAYLPDADGVDVVAKAWRAGFAVVSIDYPLAAPAVLKDGQPDPAFPGTGYPGAACSVRRAVQFVRSKAGDWNLDPDRVFLIGNSAGGNLSLWTAMTRDDAEPGSGDPIASRSSRPNGVVFVSTPTSLDPAHIVLPEGQTEITDYLGETSVAALAEAPKTARAASPAWRATHRNGGLETSPELARLNAAMPLLGVYFGLDPLGTSSRYAFPVDDPHSPAFGLLMQEAFDEYDRQGQGPPLHWADFTLLGVERDNAGQVADRMVAWLQAHAALP